MSTKVTESCGSCNDNVLPTDKAIAVEVGGGVDYPIKMWRYSCGCGNVWANYDQRTHNYHAYKAAVRKAHSEGLIQ